jgi:hypothetical protein
MNTGSYSGGGVGAIGQVGSGTGNSDNHHFEYVNNNIGPHGSTTYDHGIYHRARDILAEGNIIHNVTGYGLRTDRPSSGIPASNSIFRRNRIYNCRAGINVGGGSNIQTYNNLIYNNTTSVSGGILVANGDPNNSRIYNNTIVGNSGYCIRVREGTGHNVQNNICWQNTDNTIHDVPGSNMISKNLFTDPSFVDLPRADFALSRNSDAIDKGTFVSVIEDDFSRVPRPQGKAFDLGAFEYTDAPANLRLISGK